MTKKCIKCGKKYAENAFYKNRKMKGGRLNTCKYCSARYLLQWRVKNPVVYSPKINEIRNEWRSRNRDKYRAHTAVYDAKKKGILLPMPCEVCGSTKVQAHHDDYSKKLDVRWLCIPHHVELHKNLKTFPHSA